MLLAENAAAALSGDDRALARIADPELLACRSADDVAAYRRHAGGSGFEDLLVAGIVLTWSGDAPGAYALLRESHDRAAEQGSFQSAAAALERLAHEALIFGDVDLARATIDEAMRLAAARGLTPWLLRCSVAAARFALDAGDLTAAAHLLDRAVGHARPPGMLAACAPIGAQLATERGDSTALAMWTGPEIVAAALRSDTPEVAVAATIALLTAADAAKTDVLQTRLALRRALLSTNNPVRCPELFSMAARYGDLEEARLASRALAAVPAPNRRYLRAHRLLARAYLAFRFGGRAAWADHASDAARAFNAMGLRRWTNEAMLLLVRQPGGGRHGGHGRAPHSMLTEREQQVADLIRRGARNREVALALQISEHTVERHVSSILGRLGLRSRWQIVDTRKKNED